MDKTQLIKQTEYKINEYRHLVQKTSERRFKLLYTADLMRWENQLKSLRGQI